MQFHRITKGSDPSLTFIKKLYEDAFPPHERRDWDSLIKLIPKSPEMHLDLIHTDDGHIGFIIWWEISTDNYFVEHFAIDAELRGKNYGASVLNYYKQLLTGRILLEVEPPEDEYSIRRIGFYERLGFKVQDFSYRQPSYADPLVSYPMLLMGTTVFEEKELTVLTKIIKTKVYAAKSN
ncbi:GNAT family N-acetyltransferase [Pedobacter gandavensis]|uniref:GNAT family N-acetyltransferase n=1 Tax=Pedobacter gandavensis TaxID=2679963 RepID=UPI00292F40D2|nr:GNAT family N-acetyltransferase [Pedobacter gandavensis]